MRPLKNGLFVLVLAVSAPHAGHANVPHDIVDYQESGSLTPLHDVMINQHASLSLTPEQEALWQKYVFAYQRFYDDTALEDEDQVYTSSVEKMERLADIDLIHALDKKLMVEAFKPLYDSLSVAQKKKVDEPTSD